MNILDSYCTSPTSSPHTPTQKKEKKNLLSVWWIWRVRILSNRVIDARKTPGKSFPAKDEQNSASLFLTNYKNDEAGLQPQNISSDLKRQIPPPSPPPPTRRPAFPDCIAPQLDGAQTARRRTGAACWAGRRAGRRAGEQAGGA